MQYLLMGIIAGSLTHRFKRPLIPSYGNMLFHHFYHH